jgi:DNA polymerase V
MEHSVLEIPSSPGKRPIDFAPETTEAAIGPLDLNHLIQHPDATFLIRHKDLSMINAFIPPDAQLIVDDLITPQNNSIVLANVNRILMVRFLKKNDYNTTLVPANPKYPESKIKAGTSFAILGIITHVTTDPGKLGNVC